MIDRKPLIVVVHEDPETLSALELLLSEQNYLVATFTSAFRSLEFIQRNKPDLILAQEPSLKPKGIEFLETIKRFSPSTEGIFLPSPVTLEAPGRLRQSQAVELLRIVERLLGIMVLPQPRRRVLVV